MRMLATSILASAEAIVFSKSRPSRRHAQATRRSTPQSIRSALAAKLRALLRAHPRIEVQLHVSDRFVDLVHESIDIAVRSHAAPLSASGLVQPRMVADRIILAAMPAWSSMERPAGRKIWPIMTASMAA